MNNNESINTHAHVPRIPIPLSNLSMCVWMKGRKPRIGLGCKAWCLPSLSKERLWLCSEPLIYAKFGQKISGPFTIAHYFLLIVYYFSPIVKKQSFETGVEITVCKKSMEFGWCFNQSITWSCALCFMESIFTQTLTGKRGVSARKSDRWRSGPRLRALRKVCRKVFLWIWRYTCIFTADPLPRPLRMCNSQSICNFIPCLVGFLL